MSRLHSADKACIFPAGFQSSVVCVTGDFAMQNVILQMGLRLAAPTGQQIDRLARWALRCTACFKICKVGGSSIKGISTTVCSADLQMAPMSHALASTRGKQASLCQS